ncbi:MAG: hypothetical protein HYU63_04450 [Armatimonadetes bacterium]|nr:hypothetical protein [Armatimonadota bacterium]
MNFFEKSIKILGKNIKGKSNIPILIGGWAVNMLGIPRQTVDFDIMIPEEDFGIISEVLDKIGYKEVIKTGIHARFKAKQNSYFTLPFIDCLFADIKTYSILKNQGKKINIFGSEFILPDVKHIIAMKLHALKYRKGIEENKDINDIITLIKIHNLDISTGSEFYNFCLKYGSKNILRKILNEKK